MRAILDRVAKTPQPPALKGFESIQRYWDPQGEVWTAKILPGEYYVTQSDEGITTVLGSCVSACVRDAHLGIGGMNHFMLPDDSSSGTNTWTDPVLGLSTRYGSYAMESLVNNLLKLGAARNRLEIKLFGGGRILTSMTDVGARNIEFIHQYAKLEGYAIAAEDLGGTQPRRVVYFPTSGRVKVRRLKAIENRSIGDRERQYLANLGKQQQDGGEVELFD
jgi:chemotaxis protein CheD